MLEDIKTIYHYCSVEAFMKIVASGKFWLSHVQTTNDSLEDRMYAKCIRQICDEVSTTMPDYKDLFDKITKSYVKKSDFPYIGSFSREKDKLSQWIAYGDNGQGICMGFDLSKFSFFDIAREKHGQGEPAICIDEVTYGLDQDEGFIRNLFITSDILRNKYKLDDEEIEKSALQLLELFSVFTKNAPFEDEAEVRMVYFPNYHEILYRLTNSEAPENIRLPIQFRTKNSEIISYFAYPLPQGCISEITLGPKCKTDFKQLTLFLSQYLPYIRTENKIFVSKASYR